MNHGPHGPELLHEEETFAIQQPVFEVNRHMGSGFLEAVYQECLTIEFKTREIPFVAMPSLVLTYKNVSLRQRY